MTRYASEEGWEGAAWTDRPIDSLMEAKPIESAEYILMEIYEARSAAMSGRICELQETIKQMVLVADKHRDSYGCSLVREIGGDGFYPGPTTEESTDD